MRKYMIIERELGFLCRNKAFYYWSNLDDAYDRAISFNWLTVRLKINIIRALAPDLNVFIKRKNIG